MTREILAALSLLLLLCQTIRSDEMILPEILTNPPDQTYFAKYGPCSISISRLHDAYFVEGKLAAVIIKGLNNLDNETHDYEDREHDDDLKKTMYQIIEARDNENATSNFTNNPINALNFMTRIITQFNPLLNSIFTSAKLMTRIFHKDLSAIVDRYIREESSCWPTPNDIILLVKSISRISKTYGLPKKNLVEGYIYSQQAFRPLSLDQAIALAHEANRNSYYDDVIDWTKYLLANTNINADEDNVNWKTLVRITAGALFKTDKVQESINFLESSIKGENTKILKRDLEFYKGKKSDITPSSDENSQETPKNYDDLCQRESPLNEDSGLKCYYRQIGTLWDRVQVEIISRNPPAFKYYKVIKEPEILHLFDVVKTLKIKMSAYHEKEGIVTDTKLSREMAVVWDDEHHITKHLSQRISYLTGLEIINYGIGGYVEPHTDYLALDKSSKKKDISVFGGDRMATWMYHLSDKVRGGQIVLLKSNVTVSLEKGSGILLFNIFKNGTVNPASEYMECPVILGSKWVATKYIHENGNMFKRKCAVNKRAFF